LPSLQANECSIGDTKTEPEKNVKCRVWCSKGENMGGQYERGTGDIVWEYDCKAGPGSLPGKGGWSASGSKIEKDCDANCESCFTQGDVEWW